MQPLLIGILLRAAVLSLSCLALPSLAQETIRIGAVYSTTGPGSFLGAPEERVLRMLVDSANRSGGWGGKRLDLVLYDTESNTNKTAQQYRRLTTSDNVHVILGPSSSGESLAVIGLANEFEIPTLMHGGTEAITRPGTHWVFNTVPNDRIAITGILAHMKKLDLRSVALLSAADGQGQSGKKIVNELAESYGIKLATQEEFGRQDPDITAQVLRARESKADAMLIWSSLPAPIVILRAARALNYDKPIFTGYGAGTNDLIEQAAGAAEGLYLYSLRLLAAESIPENDPAKAAITQLSAEYLARYKVPAPVYAQHAYDAFKILEKAVSSIRGPITRTSLRDAIEKTEFSGTNGYYRFSPQNHGGLDSNSRSFVMLRSIKGKWVAAE